LIDYFEKSSCIEQVQVTLFKNFHKMLLSHLSMFYHKDSACRLAYKFLQGNAAAIAKYCFLPPEVDNQLI